MPFTIPTSAIILLILAGLIWLTLPSETSKKEKPKKKEKRRVIIGSMTHYVGSNLIAYSDFRRMYLDFPDTQGTVFLCCQDRTIEVYQSLESAYRMAGEDTHSILEVTLVGDPEWSVKVEQVTEGQTGVRTELGFGIIAMK
ncbi:hypothetical protein RVBP21_1910 [Pseudomonas phage BRkr]|nr:hypothetical protein RVBP21_1910 [Pseudomonas phage BRkr]